MDSGVETVSSAKKFMAELGGNRHGQGRDAVKEQLKNDPEMAGNLESDQANGRMVPARRNRPTSEETGVNAQEA